jgi:predicted ATPase
MLESIFIQGYKSFRELELPLAPVNVLIGANGSGKSNFIGMFKMLHRMMNGELQLHVAQTGGADQVLHYGRKVTEEMILRLWFRRAETLANGYECHLKPAEDRLVLSYEATYFHDRSRYPKPYQDLTHAGVYEESLLPQWAKSGGISRYVYEALQSWQLYHFHDTGETARMKQMGDIHQNFRLFNPEKIRLEWRERGSDLIFGANALSDGTLRFICLTVLFLQPQENLPATIVLDEPELGLHPYAIKLLAEMVYSAAEHTQVILATQSVPLVNQFSPEDILVVDRIEGISTIRRLDPAEIQHWLDDYGLGDLWEKNILGGRPAL